MRDIVAEQRPLTPQYPDHPHSHELRVISDILDEIPEAVELVHGDLVRRIPHPQRGRRGMSAEQVLRVVVLKQMTGFSYQTLSFHLLDSQTYQAFCRFPFGRVPRRSALQRNLKALRPETMEAVNRILVKLAATLGIEKGRVVGADCTVVDTDIHHPMDSALLFDSVRVLTRLMESGRESFPIRFADHTRRAKRRALGIIHAKDGRERRSLYRNLVKVTRETLEDAGQYVKRLADWKITTWELEAARDGLMAELERYIGLAHRVVDQTTRRVFEGEEVPATEKILSIFEPHTDIIVKSRRETEFGHKVCLTAGRSTMILDCVVLEGNPPDSELAVKIIERQIEIYNRPPRQSAFDGSFAAKANLSDIKELGVKDVCFSKKRGLAVADMVKSSWVYRKLRDFRAGIEGGISFLKRAFSLDRCTWEGFESFKSYVWASVVSANLLIMARHLLA